MKNVLAVIPARGGSKAIPDKNIVDLCGKPLIAYSIEAALGSKLITDHVFSTDSEKIASFARTFGANIPFMRPEELAKDDTSSVDVVIHALNQMEKINKKQYEVIIVLQPTNPMRGADMIDNALNHFSQSDFDSIISVVDVGANHPYRMYNINDKSGLVPFLADVLDPTMPRQQLPSVYIRSGDIYAVRRSCLVEQQSLIGKNPQAFLIKPEETINIDTNEDLMLARLRMKEK